MDNDCHRKSHVTSFLKRVDTKEEFAMSHHEGNNDTKALQEKIKDIRFAMLTTVEADGSLHSRPMATLNTKDFSGDLWFFTYADAPKVGKVQQHHQVNLSYAKPDDNLFVSVSGTAELVRDRQKIKDFWNPMLKSWFPKGEDDPNLALLKVHVDAAEYWDAPNGKMGALFTNLTALATGAKKHAGEDVKLDRK